MNTHQNKNCHTFHVRRLIALLSAPNLIVRTKQKQSEPVFVRFFCLHSYLLFILFTFSLKQIVFEIRNKKYK